MITVGSLSSGYGGLEMALAQWLGAGAIDVRWHSEIDPDASLVLKTHWPDVPNAGSFTEPGFWERAERTHVQCGGIPCQGFSAAGRQLGEADPRHLWPFWRPGIELHRPATVVFENVANLTRGKMRPIFDGIVRDLLDLGYDVRWCLLGACAVGAAHHRHRVFLLACRTRTTPNAREVKVQTCGQHAAAYLPTPSAVSYGSNQGGGAGRTGPVRHSLDALARLDLLPTTASRDGSTRGEGSPEFWERRREQGGVRAVAGVTLGAALSLLPTPVAKDAESTAPTEWERNSLALRAQVLDFCRTPAARDGEQRGQGSVEHMRRRVEAGHTVNLGDQMTIMEADGRWGKFAPAIARHEAVLGRPAPEPTELGPKGGRRLAAAFSEWLMMLPEGHLTSVLDRNPALARAGNGVVPLQAATALRLLFEDL